MLLPRQHRQLLRRRNGELPGGDARWLLVQSGRPRIQREWLRAGSSGSRGETVTSPENCEFTDNLAYQGGGLSFFYADNPGLTLGPAHREFRLHRQQPRRRRRRARSQRRDDHGMPDRQQHRPCTTAAGSEVLGGGTRASSAPRSRATSRPATAEAVISYSGSLDVDRLHGEWKHCRRFGRRAGQRRGRVDGPDGVHGQRQYRRQGRRDL